MGAHSPSSPLHWVARLLVRSASSSSSGKAGVHSAPRGVRGTQDVLPPACGVRSQIVECFEAVVRTYAYARVEAPVLEQTRLFSRGLGEGSDVVAKEMFTFTPWQQQAQVQVQSSSLTGATVATPAAAAHDRSGEHEESLSLRPEGTAGVLRAAMASGALARHAPTLSGGSGSGTTPPSTPLRLYYHGPMFRYERPQRGRQRQFTQLGLERLGGGTSPAAITAADVEAVTTAAHVLAAVLPLVGGADGGVDSPPPLRLSLLVNSLGGEGDRAAYTAALRTYLAGHADALSEDSKARVTRGSTLRVLDSKAPEDVDIIHGAPAITEYLSPPSRAAFDDVCAALGEAGALPPGITLTPSPRLVRGLDYYSGLIFEFVAEGGSGGGSGGPVGTVLAGGRYDGLPTLLGYAGTPPPPAIGWAAGLERLALFTHFQPSTGPDVRGPAVAVIPVLDRPPKAGGACLDAEEGGTGGGPSSSSAAARAIGGAATRVAHVLRASLNPSLFLDAGRGASLSPDMLACFAHLGGSEGTPQPTRVLLMEAGVPLKRSLPAAVEAGAAVAVILGSAEVAAGRAVVKDLKTGTQREVAMWC